MIIALRGEKKHQLTSYVLIPAKSPGCSPLLGWPMRLSSWLVLAPVQLKPMHLTMSPFAYMISVYFATLVYRNDGFRQNYSWEDIS
jgi:hypothetical protein